VEALSSALLLQLCCFDAPWFLFVSVEVLHGHFSAGHAGCSVLMFSRFHLSWLSWVVDDAKSNFQES
jgi:hypothetical protein